MVAPKVCTGFEFGNTTLTGWVKGNAGNRLCDVVTGTPSIVSTGSVRTGTYCLQLAASASVEVVRWDTNTLGAGNTRVLFGFAFMFPTALPSANVTIAQIQTTFVDGTFFLRNSDKRLVASCDGTIGNGQAGPVIVADTWYYVELYQDASANTHTLDWWVNGVPQTQSTAASTLGTISLVQFGTGGAQTMTCRYDDVVAWCENAAITRIGNHKVVMLTPSGTAVEIGTANGTGRMVTNSAIDATFNSANIIAALTEIPPLLGATATGWGQRTSGTGIACGIPMSTYTLGTGESFSGLRVLVAGWSSTAVANNLEMRSFNGTTEDVLFAVADPNFDALDPCGWLCKMAIDTRFDTQTEVDALVVRLGYSTDISPLPGAHAIYAEVAVRIPEPTQTISPDAQTVTATPGTLTISQAGGSQAVTPGAVTATVTSGTVSVSQNVVPAATTAVVTAGTTSLTVDVVPASSTVTATPGTLAVSLASGAQSVTPAVVTIGATAGTVALGMGVTPAVATATLTPGTPTITQTQPVTPDAVTATLTPGTVTVVRLLQTITPTPVTVTATPGLLTVGDIPIVPMAGWAIGITDNSNNVLITTP